MPSKNETPRTVIDTLALLRTLCEKNGNLVKQQDKRIKMLIREHEAGQAKIEHIIDQLEGKIKTNIDDEKKTTDEIGQRLLWTKYRHPDGEEEDAESKYDRVLTHEALKLPEFIGLVVKEARAAKFSKGHLESLQEISGLIARGSLTDDEDRLEQIEADFEELKELETSLALMWLAVPDDYLEDLDTLIANRVVPDMVAAVSAQVDDTLGLADEGEVGDIINGALFDNLLQFNDFCYPAVRHF
jgi:hypothetical protein